MLAARIARLMSADVPYIGGVKVEKKQPFAPSLLASLLVLSACGGGGGSDDPGQSDAVPLSSRADVLRELSIVSGIVGLADFGSGDPQGAQASSKARPLTSLRWSRSGQMGGVTPKAAAECDAGSGTVDDGDKSETFQLFSGVTRQAYFTLENYNHCQRVYDDGSYHEVYESDGVTESGWSFDEDYSYDESGQGAEPYSFVYSYTSGAEQYRYEATFTGRQEFQHLDDRTEARTLADTRIEETTTGSAPYSLYLQMGSSQGYFAYAHTPSGGLVSGPYHYESSECSGGSAVVSTVTALQFDAQTGAPIGGTLRIDAGNQSATIVFNADRSASYQTSGGASGLFSTSEVDAALDEPSC